MTRLILSDKRITEREIVKVLHKMANKDCPMTRNEEEIQEEVDGLAMDMEMTREQLIEKFGARQTIKMPGDEDEDELQGSVIVLLRFIKNLANFSRQKMRS